MFDEAQDTYYKPRSDSKNNRTENTIPHNNTNTTTMDSDDKDDLNPLEFSCLVHSPMVVNVSSSSSISTGATIPASSSSFSHPFSNKRSLPGLQAFDIVLTETFYKENRRLVEAGQAHVCIPWTATLQKQQQQESSETKNNNNKQQLLIVLPLLQNTQQQEQLVLLNKNNNKDDTVVANTTANTTNPKEHRHLTTDARPAAATATTTTGVKRLLAVRVLAAGGLEVPEETLSDMEMAIFGTSSTSTNSAGTAIPRNSDDDPFVSVTQQYYKVSHGALQWIPATWKAGLNAATFASNADGTSTATISSGVVEITIPSSLQGQNVQDYDIQQEIWTALSNLLLLDDNNNSDNNNNNSPNDNNVTDMMDIADHFLISLPTGSLLHGQDTWTAFTYKLEMVSFYQRARITSLSVVMHEMGHSLGFAHSGQGNNSYADTTGYMGYSYFEFGLPPMAFNAHKHWMSGWYDDSVKITIAPDTSSGHGSSSQKFPACGSLASFVDYRPPLAPVSASSEVTTAAKPKYDAILIQLGDSLYAQYNVGKGYNIYGGNLGRVTIVGASDPRGHSSLLAALEPSQSATFSSAQYFSSYAADGSSTTTATTANATGSSGAGILTVHFCAARRNSETGVHTAYLVVTLDEYDTTNTMACMQHSTSNGFGKEVSSSLILAMVPPPRPSMEAPMQRPTKSPSARGKTSTTKTTTLAPGLSLSLVVGSEGQANALATAPARSIRGSHPPTFIPASRVVARDSSNNNKSPSSSGMPIPLGVFTTAVIHGQVLRKRPKIFEFRDQNKLVEQESEQEMLDSSAVAQEAKESETLDVVTP